MASNINDYSSEDDEVDIANMTERHKRKLEALLARKVEWSDALGEGEDSGTPSDEDGEGYMYGAQPHRRRRSTGGRRRGARSGGSDGGDEWEDPLAVAMSINILNPRRQSKGSDERISFLAEAQLNSRSIVTPTLSGGEHLSSSAEASAEARASIGGVDDTYRAIDRAVHADQSFSLRELKRLRRIFEAFDDEGGMNFRVFVEKVGPIIRHKAEGATLRDIEVLFKRIDANANGSVDWYEISDFLLMNDVKTSAKALAGAGAPSQFEREAVSRQQPTDHPATRFLYHTEPATRLLLSARHGWYYTSSPDGTAKMWDPSTLRHERTFHASKSPIVDMCHTTWGDSIGVLAMDGTASFYAPDSGNLLRVYRAERRRDLGNGGGGAATARARIIDDRRAYVRRPVFTVPMSHRELEAIRCSEALSTTFGRVEACSPYLSHFAKDDQIETVGLENLGWLPRSALSASAAAATCRPEARGTSSTVHYTAGGGLGASSGYGGGGGGPNSSASLASAGYVSSMATFSDVRSERPTRALFGLESGHLQLYDIDHPSAFGLPIAVPNRLTAAAHAGLISSIKTCEAMRLVFTASHDGTLQVRHWDRVDDYGVRLGEGALGPDGYGFGFGGTNGGGLIAEGHAADAAQRGHSRRVTAMDWSLRSRAIASCGLDRDALLWSPYLPRPVARLEGEPMAHMLDIRFCDAAHQVLTLCSNRTVKLWDLRTYRCVHTLRDGHGPRLGHGRDREGSGLHVAAIDARRGAVVLGTTFPRQWLVVQNKRYGPLYVGHRLPIIGMALSAQFGQLVTADERTIIVWDAVQQSVIVRWRLSEGATGITLDANGRRLLVSTLSGSVLVHNYVNAQLLKRCHPSRPPALLEGGGNGADAAEGRTTTYERPWLRQPSAPSGQQQQQRRRRGGGGMGGADSELTLEAEAAAALAPESEQGAKGHEYEVDEAEQLIIGGGGNAADDPTTLGAASASNKKGSASGGGGGANSHARESRFVCFGELFHPHKQHLLATGLEDGTTLVYADSDTALSYPSLSLDLRAFVAGGPYCALFVDPSLLILGGDGVLVSHSLDESVACTSPMPLLSQKDPVPVHAGGGANGGDDTGAGGGDGIASLSQTLAHTSPPSPRSTVASVGRRGGEGSSSLAQQRSSAFAPQSVAGTVASGKGGAAPSVSSFRAAAAAKSTNGAASDNTADATTAAAASKNSESAAVRPLRPVECLVAMVEGPLRPDPLAANASYLEGRDAAIVGQQRRAARRYGPAAGGKKGVEEVEGSPSSGTNANIELVDSAEAVDEGEEDDLEAHMGRGQCPLIECVTATAAITPFLLITGASDGVVQLWSGRSHSEIFRFRATLSHTDAVTSLVLSVDGRFLAVGDASGYVSVFSLAALILANAAPPPSHPLSGLTTPNNAAGNNRNRNGSGSAADPTTSSLFGAAGRGFGYGPKAEASPGAVVAGRRGVSGGGGGAGGGPLAGVSSDTLKAFAFVGQARAAKASSALAAIDAKARRGDDGGSEGGRWAHLHATNAAGASGSDAADIAADASMIILMRRFRAHDGAVTALVRLDTTAQSSEKNILRRDNAEAFVKERDADYVAADDDGGRLRYVYSGGADSFVYLWDVVDVQGISRVGDAGAGGAAAAVAPLPHTDKVDAMFEACRRRCIAAFVGHHERAVTRRLREAVAAAIVAERLGREEARQQQEAQQLHQNASFLSPAAAGGAGSTLLGSSQSSAVGSASPSSGQGLGAGLVPQQRQGRRLGQRRLEEAERRRQDEEDRARYASVRYEGATREAIISFVEGCCAAYPPFAAPLSSSVLSASSAAAGSGRPQLTILTAARTAVADAANEGSTRTCAHSESSLRLDECAAAVPREEDAPEDLRRLTAEMFGAALGLSNGGDVTEADRSVAVVRAVEATLAAMASQSTAGQFLAATGLTDVAKSQRHVGGERRLPVQHNQTLPPELLRVAFGVKGGVSEASLASPEDAKAPSSPPADRPTTAPAAGTGAGVSSAKGDAAPPAPSTSVRFVLSPTYAATTAAIVGEAVAARALVRPTDWVRAAADAPPLSAALLAAPNGHMLGLLTGGITFSRTPTVGTPLRSAAEFARSHTHSRDDSAMLGGPHSHSQLNSGVFEPLSAEEDGDAETEANADALVGGAADPLTAPTIATSAQLADSTARGLASTTSSSNADASAASGPTFVPPELFVSGEDSSAPPPPQLLVPATGSPSRSFASPSLYAATNHGGEAAKEAEGPRFVVRPPRYVCTAGGRGGGGPMRDGVEAMAEALAKAGASGNISQKQGPHQKAHPPHRLTREDIRNALDENSGAFDTVVAAPIPSFLTVDDTVAEGSPATPRAPTSGQIVLRIPPPAPDRPLSADGSTTNAGAAAAAAQSPRKAAAAARRTAQLAGGQSSAGTALEALGRGTLVAAQLILRYGSAAMKARYLPLLVGTRTEGPRRHGALCIADAGEADPLSAIATTLRETEPPKAPKKPAAAAASTDAFAASSGAADVNTNAISAATDLTTVSASTSTALRRPKRPRQQQWVLTGSKVCLAEHEHSADADASKSDARRVGGGDTSRDEGEEEVDSAKKTRSAISGTIFIVLAKGPFKYKSSAVARYPSTPAASTSAATADAAGASSTKEDTPEVANVDGGPTAADDGRDPSAPLTLLVIDSAEHGRFLKYTGQRFARGGYALTNVTFADAPITRPSVHVLGSFEDGRRIAVEVLNHIRMGVPFEPLSVAAVVRALVQSAAEVAERQRARRDAAAAAESAQIKEGRDEGGADLPLMARLLASDLGILTKAKASSPRRGRSGGAGDDEDGEGEDGERGGEVGDDGHSSSSGGHRQPGASHEGLREVDIRLLRQLGIAPSFVTDDEADVIGGGAEGGSGSSDALLTQSERSERRLLLRDVTRFIAAGGVPPPPPPVAPSPRAPPSSSLPSSSPSAEETEHPLAASIAAASVALRISAAPPPLVGSAAAGSGRRGPHSARRPTEGRRGGQQTQQQQQFVSSGTAAFGRRAVPSVDAPLSATMPLASPRSAPNSPRSSPREGGADVFAMQASLRDMRGVAHRLRLERAGRIEQQRLAASARAAASAKEAEEAVKAASVPALGFLSLLAASEEERRGGGGGSSEAFLAPFPPSNFAVEAEDDDNSTICDALPSAPDPVLASEAEAHESASSTATARPSPLPTKAAAPLAPADAVLLEAKEIREGVLAARRERLFRAYAADPLSVSAVFSPMGSLPHNSGAYGGSASSPPTSGGSAVLSQHSRAHHHHHLSPALGRSASNVLHAPYSPYDDIVGMVDEVTGRGSLWDTSPREMASVSGARGIAYCHGEDDLAERAGRAAAAAANSASVPALTVSSGDGGGAAPILMPSRPHAHASSQAPRPAAAPFLSGASAAVVAADALAASAAATADDNGAGGAPRRGFHLPRRPANSDKQLVNAEATDEGEEGRAAAGDDEEDNEMLRAADDYLEKVLGVRLLQQATSVGDYVSEPAKRALVGLPPYVLTEAEAARHQRGFLLSSCDDRRTFLPTSTGRPRRPAAHASPSDVLLARLSERRRVADGEPPSASSTSNEASALASGGGTVGGGDATWIARAHSRLPLGETLSAPQRPAARDEDGAAAHHQFSSREVVLARESAWLKLLTNPKTVYGGGGGGGAGLGRGLSPRRPAQRSNSGGGGTVGDGTTRVPMPPANSRRN